MFVHVVTEEVSCYWGTADLLEKFEGDGLGRKEIDVFYLCELPDKHDSYASSDEAVNTNSQTTQLDTELDTYVKTEKSGDEPSKQLILENHDQSLNEIDTTYTSSQKLHKLEAFVNLEKLDGIHMPSGILETANSKSSKYRGSYQKRKLRSNRPVRHTRHTKSKLGVKNVDSKKSTFGNQDTELLSGVTRSSPRVSRVSKTKLQKVIDYHSDVSDSDHHADANDESDLDYDGGDIGDQKADGADFKDNEDTDLEPTDKSVSKPYNCKICRKKFKTKYGHSLHMMSHTGGKPHKCEHCNKTYAQLTGLKNHQRSRCKGYVANKKPYYYYNKKAKKCVNCEEEFMDKHEFKKHRLEVHGSKHAYTCQHCNREFDFPHQYKSHVFLHTGEKPHQCEFCQKTFRVHYNLILHQCIHTGEKPYMCSECGKVFTSRTGLKDHSTRHKDFRPYACKECGKRFKKRKECVTHERIHSGEMPFQCDECGRRFGRPDHLKQHLRIHSGNKPYRCELCGQRFVQRTSLNYHKEHSHTPGHISLSKSNTTSLTSTLDGNIVNKQIHSSLLQRDSSLLDVGESNSTDSGANIPQDLSSSHSSHLFDPLIDIRTSQNNTSSGMDQVMHESVHNLNANSWAQCSRSSMNGMFS